MARHFSGILVFGGLGARYCDPWAAGNGTPERIQLVWLRSIMPRLSADLVLPFLASILQILSVFVVFWILVQFEGPQILGVWSLTMGILALTGLLNLSGAAGLPRFLPRYADEPDRQIVLIDTILLFVLMLFSAIALIGYLPLHWYVTGAMTGEGLSPPVYYVAIMVVAFVLSMLSNAESRALEGLFLARWRAAAEICGIAAFVLGSTFLVRDFGIEGVAFARAAQFAIVVLIGRVVLMAHLPGLPWLPHSFSRSAFREAMGLGVRIQSAAVAEAAFLGVSRILIQAFWGLAVLGIFEIAFRLMQSVYSVLQQTMAPLVARFAEDHTARGADHALLGSVLRKTMVFGALAFTLAVAGTPVASLILLDRVSPELLSGAAALCLGWYVALLAVPLIYYARGAGQLGATIKGYWGVCILSVLLLIGLGRAGADLQPGIGVGIAMIVGFSFMIYGITRELRLSAHALYPRSVLLPALIVVAGSAGVLAWAASSL